MMNCSSIFGQRNYHPDNLSQMQQELVHAHKEEDALASSSL